MRRRRRRARGRPPDGFATPVGRFPLTTDEGAGGATVSVQGPTFVVPGQSNPHAVGIAAVDDATQCVADVICQGISTPNLTANVVDAGNVRQATLNLSTGGGTLRAQANFAFSLGGTVIQAGCTATQSVLGFYGVAPVARAAHPAVLGDVITLLTNLGLCQ